MHYLRTNDDALNPLVSPTLAKLQGLPDTLIITAENDPLREQDLDYARKLEEAGVKVTLLNYPGMVHGFFSVPNYFAEARSAIDELAKMIKSL